MQKGRTLEVEWHGLWDEDASWRAQLRGTEDGWILEGIARIPTASRIPLLDFGIRDPHFIWPLRISFYQASRIPMVLSRGSSFMRNRIRPREQMRV